MEKIGEFLYICWPVILTIVGIIFFIILFSLIIRKCSVETGKAIKEVYDVCERMEDPLGDTIVLNKDTLSSYTLSSGTEIDAKFIEDQLNNDRINKKTKE